MILLHAIVEVAIGAMQHFSTQDLAGGPWIGIVPIRSHALRVQPVTSSAKWKNRLPAVLSLFLLSMSRSDCRRDR